MARKKSAQVKPIAEQNRAEESALLEKEQKFEKAIAAQVAQSGVENLTAIVAAGVFSLKVQDAETRLTKGGKQYDKVDLVLGIDGNKPEYVVGVVAYNKTIYSVTVFKFDGGEELYKSPKSSINNAAVWLVADAKIAPGLASELKKLLITERRAALARLAEPQATAE